MRTFGVKIIFRMQIAKVRPLLLHQYQLIIQTDKMTLILNQLLQEKTHSFKKTIYYIMSIVYNYKYTEFILVC